MPVPSLSDYQAAVQNPGTCFADPKLQQATVERDQRLLPRPRSGGFALTYHFTHGREEWAVRCFHRNVSALEGKYGAISAHLARASSQMFSSFDYQPTGIRVGTSTHPIVKMDWVRGEMLGEYIERNLQKPDVISDLAEAFRMSVLELERLGVAHGDMQRGNIMLVAGQIKLIDYDGMYVPGSPTTAVDEIGHPDYRHPQRGKQHYGPLMDRFSSILIYVALKTLTRQPDLWKDYDTGENILFRAVDIADPDHSKLFQQLLARNGADPPARQLMAVCKLPPDQVPTLTEFLHNQLPASVVAVSPIASVSAAAPRRDAIWAEDVRSLLAREGDWGEVVGQILRTKDGKSTYGAGRPYAFLNFGDYHYGCFTIVLWERVLGQLRQTHGNPQNLEGAWVSVRGLLERYEGDWSTQPQIVLESPAHLRVLAGEDEALALLAVSPAGAPEYSPNSSVASRNQLLLSSLPHRDWVQGSPPVPLPRQTPTTPLIPFQTPAIPPVRTVTPNQQILQGMSSTRQSAPSPLSSGPAVVPPVQVSVQGQGTSQPAQVSTQSIVAGSPQGTQLSAKRSRWRIESVWLRWLSVFALGCLIVGLIWLRQSLLRSMSVAIVEQVNVVLVTATPTVVVESTLASAYAETLHKNATPAAPSAASTPLSTDTPTLTSTSVPMGQVAAEALNFRAGPGEAYLVQAVLPRGTSVRLIGKDEETPRWWQVILDDGRMGWLSAAPSLVSVRSSDNVPKVRVPSTPVPSTSMPLAVTSQSTVTPVPATASPIAARGWVLVGDSVTDFQRPRGSTHWGYLFSQGRNNFEWETMTGESPDCRHAANTPRSYICADRAVASDTADIALQWSTDQSGKYLLEWQYQPQTGGGDVLVYKHTDELRSIGPGPSLPYSVVVDDAREQWDFFFFVVRANYSGAYQVSLRARIYQWQDK